MPPLELSDQEFHQITELVRPVPYASRRGFLDAMPAEVAAAGVRSPGVIRKIGQRLQARFLTLASVDRALGPSRTPRASRRTGKHTAGTSAVPVPLSPNPGITAVLEVVARENRVSPTKNTKSPRRTSRAGQEGDPRRQQGCFPLI
jgi:hypothetical protein